METLNFELLRLASEVTGLVKAANPGMMAPPPAASPAPAGGDPMMGMGGPPPIDPTAAAPPGQMPPGQVQSPAPMPGQAPPSMSAGGAGKKMKPEEMSMAYRMYNIQVQLTAILNHFEIKIPPEALLNPPGPDGVPIPEQAAPGTGSPVDLATQPPAQGDPAAAAGGAPPVGDPAAGGGQSAIPPIEPMGAAMPQKAASWDTVDAPELAEDEIPQLTGVPSPQMTISTSKSSAERVAAMLQQFTGG